MTNEEPIDVIIACLNKSKCYRFMWNEKLSWSCAYLQASVLRRQEEGMKDLRDTSDRPDLDISKSVSGDQD